MEAMTGMRRLWLRGLAMAVLAIALTGCGDLSLIEALAGDSPGKLLLSPSTALVPEGKDFTFGLQGGIGPYEVMVGSERARSEGPSWVFGGKTLADPATPELFTVQVTDLPGSSVTAQVTVYAVPAPLSLDVTEVTLIVGSSWTFNASGGSGSYSWSVDGVQKGTGGSYEYTADTEGSHTVTVTDSLVGLSQEATVTVKASDAGGPLEISPLAVTLALNGTASFWALGGAGGYTFEVAAGGVGGSISAASGNSAVYTAPGTITTETVTDTVQLRDGTGTTVAATVIVIDPAATPLSLYPQNPTVPGAGSTLQFQASGGTGPGTYTFTSGKPEEGRIDLVTGFYEQIGIKNVKVIVTDASGATASTVVRVK
jgi:hypothetical protein